MGGGQLVQVKELRDGERLLVRADVIVLVLAGDFGANAEGAAGHIQVNVLGIHAGQRNVDSPTVVGRVHVEGC